MKMAANRRPSSLYASEDQSGLAGEWLSWFWLAMSAASAAMPRRPRITGEIPNP
jgi:hypothetical protein